MNSRDFFDLTSLVMTMERRISLTEDESERAELIKNRQYFFDKLWDEIVRVQDVIKRHESD